MSRLVALGKDVKLALALASGAGSAEAASECRVSLRTVQRRLADPGFRKMVFELREQYVSRALGRVAENMTSAADKLVALLESDKPALQLRTARPSSPWVCGCAIWSIWPNGVWIPVCGADFHRVGRATCCGYVTLALSGFPYFAI